MQCSVQYGFSILLPVNDAVRVFGDQLKLSCVVAVPQSYRQWRLILNMLANTDEGTLSVRDTAYRWVTLESMHIFRAFPRILKAIW